MNDKEKQELKELIREVVREEIAKLNYNFIPDVKPSHTIDTQSVSVYACPIYQDKHTNITYTTSTERVKNE